MTNPTLAEWRQLEAFAASVREKASGTLSVSGDVEETTTAVREVNDVLEQLQEDMVALQETARERLSIGNITLPQSIDTLLRPIGSSFAAEQENEDFEAIKTLVSIVGDTDQLLGTFNVQIDEVLSQSSALIATVTKRVKASDALKKASIEKMVKSVEREAKSFVEHVDELTEGPFNETNEQIENFRGDTLEGPVGEVLEAVQEVEGLIETLEDSGITQLEELASVVDDVMTAVEVVKSIPAP